MAGIEWAYDTRPQISRLPNESNRFTFRDLNCDFMLDNKPLVVDDDLALHKQIKNILSTPLGTEHGEPLFGSNLPYRLHDPISDTTSFLMETDTIIALARWLSGRLVLIQPFIEPIYDEDGYNIVLPYVKIVNGKTTQPTFYAFQALR